MHRCGKNVRSSYSFLRLWQCMEWNWRQSNKLCCITRTRDWTENIAWIQHGQHVDFRLSLPPLAAADTATLVWGFEAQPILHSKTRRPTGDINACHERFSVQKEVFFFFDARKVVGGAGFGFLFHLRPPGLTFPPSPHVLQGTLLYLPAAVTVTAEKCNTLTTMSRESRRPWNCKGLIKTAQSAEMLANCKWHKFGLRIKVPRYCMYCILARYVCT